MLDFDDAGVGRDLEIAQLGNRAGRWVAFDQHREAQFGSRLFDGRHQGQVVFQAGEPAA